MDPRKTLGVDIGGTKTRFVMATGDTIEREMTVETPSWRTHSHASNAVALSRLVREWLGDDALDWAIGVGAHGCDSTELCDFFAAELGRYFTGAVRVVNDAELLTRAAGLSDGIGVIAGTGSIAVARVGGQLVTAGGWGWVLGDEGSAAGLVREAARAVLGALDRGERLDQLGRRLLESVRVEGGPELALAVSTADSTAWVGSHAEEIFRAADEGSVLAEAVVRRAGAELATLIDRLIGRGVDGRRIVAGGTVILAQPLLREVFVDAVAARHPESTVQFLDRPPVLGALALATSEVTAP
jgi:N-acetylglucosamine kinase-like BadF-type ATPase